MTGTFTTGDKVSVDEPSAIVKEVNAFNRSHILWDTRKDALRSHGMEM